MDERTEIIINNMAMRIAQSEAEKAILLADLEIAKQDMRYINKDFKNIRKETEDE